MQNLCEKLPCPLARILNARTVTDKTECTCILFLHNICVLNVINLESKHTVTVKLTVTVTVTVPEWSGVEWSADSE